MHKKHPKERPQRLPEQSAWQVQGRPVARLEQKIQWVDKVAKDHADQAVAPEGVPCREEPPRAAPSSTAASHNARHEREDDPRIRRSRTATVAEVRRDFRLRELHQVDRVRVQVEQELVVELDADLERRGLLQR